MSHPVVLLDVGETLVAPRDSFGAVYARVLATLGAERPVGVLATALRDAWSELEGVVPRGADRYGWFPGGESAYWLRFVRGVLERSGDGRRARDLAPRALEALRRAFAEPTAWMVYPDVVPALESLRRAGVRMGVVSNWDSRLPSLLERLGLLRYFETLAVSHLEGCEKPDPRIFARALTRMGVRSGAALHVGDVPDLDVAGARAAGLRAVLVDRRALPPRRSGVIRDLSSLTSLVLEDGGRT